MSSEILASTIIQNTTNSAMSSYEKYSLIISIIAIAISIGVPLLQWLYKKTKRLKLSIIPFENNPPSLLFNESGCYFKLMFCIQCENQDTTITSIEVTLKRQSDTWEKTYKWSSLDSIYLNWFGNNTANRINSATYARPYKIKENTLEPFIIEFLIQDDASKVNSECNANETSLFQFMHFNPDYQISSCKTIDELKTTIASIKAGYKRTNEYSSINKTLKQYFYWKADKYLLNLSIHYGVDKCKQCTYEFEISQEESDEFSKNFEEITFCRLHKSCNLPNNLFSLNKNIQSHT